MTGVLLERGNLDTGADHQRGLMKSRDSRKRWPFSRQGIPKVPEARREPSPETSEGEKPCWHFNLQLLASISVRQCNSAVLSSLICGPVLQEPEEPNGDLPDPGMEPRLLVLQADSLLSEPPGNPGNYNTSYMPGLRALPLALRHQQICSGRPLLDLPLRFPKTLQPVPHTPSETLHSTGNLLGTRRFGTLTRPIWHLKNS